MSPALELLTVSLGIMKEPSHHRAEAESVVHYHLVAIEGGRGKPIATFESCAEAEEEADALSHLSDDWVASKYPGRSSRPGEVAVYLDRRPLARRVTTRELVVIRCDAETRRAQGIRCPSQEPDESSVVQQETGPMPIAPSSDHDNVASDHRMSVFLEHNLVLAVVVVAAVVATLAVGSKLGLLETLLRAAHAVSQATAS